MDQLPQTERVDGAGGAGARRLVWPLAVAQLVSWGVVYYSFAAFIVPIEADLGWSRESLTFALSLGLLTGGLAAPLVGGWIDARGGRGVMMLGTLLAAAMLAIWAVTSDYAIFCLTWIGLGLAQAMTLYEPAFAILHRELRDRAPGAIMRVTLVAGFASTLFIPLSFWLAGTLGWRTTALLLALLLLLVCLPIHALLPARAPAPGRPGPAVAPVRLVRQAAAKPAFWGLFISYSAGALVIGAIAFHIVPLLLERGLTGAEAMLVVAVIGPAQVLGRLGIFLFWQDVRPGPLGRAVSLMLPLGLLVLLEVPALWGALLFAALYGLGNGLTTIVRGTAAAHFLGREGFGAINGTLAMPAALSRAVGPAVAAAIWGASGGYPAVLWALAGAGLVAACAFWWASAATPRSAPAAGDPAGRSLREGR